MPIDWRHYRSQAFDELLEAAGEPRTAARPLVEYLSGLSTAELAARRLASELTIKAMGITFTVYSDGRNVDRAWPFDILPRVISRTEWERTQAGLKQRVTALNCFRTSTPTRRSSRTACSRKRCWPIRRTSGRSVRA